MSELMTGKIQFLLPFIINILRYVLIAGVPFVIFYIFYPSFFRNNKIQGKMAKQKDFIREVCYSLQTSFILAGVGILMLTTPLRSFTRFYTDPFEYPLSWIPLSVFIALFIHDTYFYWMHRLIHHPKIFRRVHLVHHKSVNPSPLASYSFHFLEGLLEAMIAPIILILLPVNVIALIFFTFLSFSINVYGHLGYEIAPKWIRNSLLFEIISTSTYHNLHHSRFEGNYGLYFRLWDRIMGTENPDYVKAYDAIQARRFGCHKHYATRRLKSSAE